MPKKKRRAKKSPPRARRSVPNQAARIGTAFRTSRVDRGHDPDDAWIVEVLIDLKRDYLDVADPTVWPAAETRDLLTTLLPRKVSVPPEEHDLVVPVLGDFFTFLHERGRWSPGSLPFEDVPQLIDELAVSVPRILSDPGRRGMTGNLFHYALSQGVDLADESAMAEFVEQYNSLSDEERRAITDTGGLPSEPAATGRSSAAPAGAAFGLGTAATGRPWDNPYDDPFDDYGSPYDDSDEPFDGLDLLDDWPDFLGDPPDPEAGIAAMASADPQTLTSTALTLRADQLLRLLGDGRPLTGTNSLRLADLTELLAMVGIDRTARSMWDVPEIAMLWATLQAGGFLEIRGGSAYPAAAGVPWVWPDGDPGERLLAVRMLHVAGLLLLVGDPEDPDAMASPLLEPALLKAAEPGGLTVTIPEDPDGLIVAVDLLEDLSAMVELGLLDKVDAEQTFHLNPALLELTPTAVEAAMAAAPLDEE